MPKSTFTYSLPTMSAHLTPSLRNQLTSMVRCLFEQKAWFQSGCPCVTLLLIIRGFSYRSTYHYSRSTLALIICMEWPPRLLPQGPYQRTRLYPWSCCLVCGSLALLTSTCADTNAHRMCPPFSFCCFVVLIDLLFKVVGIKH
jgi:hypothetical protein